MAHLGGEMEDLARRGMIVCSRVFDDEDEDDMVWLDDAVWWLPAGELGRWTGTSGFIAFVSVAGGMRPINAS